MKNFNTVCFKKTLTLLNDENFSMRLMNGEIKKKSYRLLQVKCEKLVVKCLQFKCGFYKWKKNKKLNKSDLQILLYSDIGSCIGTKI